MDFKESKKFLISIATIYWFLVVLFYFAAGEQFHTTERATNPPLAYSYVGEVVDGQRLRQKLVLPAGDITGLDVMLGTFARENTGELCISLEDEARQQLASKVIPIAGLENNAYMSVLFDSPIPQPASRTACLVISSKGCVSGNAVTVFYGNVMSGGKIQIAQQIPEDECYSIDGIPGAGKLCVKLYTREKINFYLVYWVITGGAFLAAGLLCRYWWLKLKRGEPSPLFVLCTIFTKYKFLIQQLVSRDFKVKYKRSTLGIAWSFLNPLLTMSVQYLIFSTLFKSSTANYAVYLLIGIVFFSFFSEAVSLGMLSIASNVGLIKKVYLPQYIYPLTRVISSLINLAISMIPLLLVSFITGLLPRPSYFLLIYVILCMLLFVLGMVLLLSTCMTFFQDTQFLWSVFSMLWMYMTPLFYTESIIPESLLPIYRMNPMYQYITFARTCIIDGISPAPISYLWCLLSGVIVFTIGVLVFRKNQDKFILYL